MIPSLHGNRTHLNVNISYHYQKVNGLNTRLLQQLDGRLLVAGGKSRFLHVWCLDTHSLMRVIELPTKVHVVKQLQFLPESFDGGSGQVVGVLSQDGIMRFMNIFSCRLDFDIGTLEDRILNVDISPTGRHIVAIVESGCINLYCVSALTAERNKPPPPLVKMATQKPRVRSYTKSQAQGMGRSKTIKTEEPRLPMDVASIKDTEAEVSGLPEGLDMNRLKAILKGYGEYPAKYRMFIWRSVLRLPENHAAFSSLVDKGTHMAWSKVHQDYPIKSRKLLRVLQRTLSALAHWSVVFGETNYLPVLAFPFIKLFQNNQLVCFEIIATVLINWCQHWFEFFPNPPINILSVVENLLAHHDKALLQHFVKHGITTQVYAWPMMETLFSEIVTRDEWLKLWDNIFTNHPSFMMYVVAAYLICSRQPLINCVELSDFEYFFHHRNPVDITAVIKCAYELQNTTPNEINPVKAIEDFRPLTRGQYPVFNKYPKFIVDYQAQEREQIRQDEMDYLHQREVANEIKEQTELRKKKEEGWYHQQELLQEAEEERRRNLMTEEQKLADQRLRLQAMKRELCMREMQVLDATRMRFMEHQGNQRETQLRRLDDELTRKSFLREQETQSAVADVEIKSMELEIQKERLHQELAKESSTVEFKEKLYQDSHRRQTDLAERVSRKTWHSNQLDHQQDSTNAQWRLALADQRKTDLEYQNEVKHRQRLDDIDRKLHQLQISTLQTKSTNEEEAIWDTIEELKREKDLIWEMLIKQKEREGNADVIQPVIQIQSDNSPQQTNDEFSLDRGRLVFPEREKELLQHVRELRAKIASDKSHRP
ncbi:TBC1 domain family member 31-like isoform X2 [Antedon mediterranea]|uniref:TBC1 domain family member 31-like isoform X2 n=1 Tax=Antedon mediterranea TaxID=105859 RepID=UPI003AF7ED29